ncbi:MAG: membrane lipoprotein lipid attachment site-containing protein [Chitinophagaceae bacterium]
MKKIFCILLIAATLTGCSKDNGGSNDRVAPAVTLSSPVADQAFASGQAIAITGTITDSQKIAEVHIHISNSDNGSLLVDIHRYPGTGSYSLNETFMIPGPGTYRIQVIAKDNSANEGRATVNITGN